MNNGELIRWSSIIVVVAFNIYVFKVAVIPYGKQLYKEFKEWKKLNNETKL